MSSLDTRLVEDNGLGGTIIFFMMVAWAIGIPIYSSFQPDPVCIQEKTVISVSPIGHRNATSYLVTYTDKTMSEDYTLHQIGEKVCTKYNK